MPRVQRPITMTGVAKRYGRTAALAGLDLRAEPGRVTGLLGPNGAGKSTALRVLLGLVRADAGEALIGGQAYVQIAHPLRTVGAMIDPATAEPAVSGSAHLRTNARLAGLPRDAIDRVVDEFELGGYVRRPVGGWSTGMRQRLALATAMLGDPDVVILDEPTNGLDPDGIEELRARLRAWADEGRTVLVSSHVLAEMEPILDDALIIREGRAVAAGPVGELLASTGAASLESAYRATRQGAAA